MIRARGLPAALVAQDGWCSAAVDWSAFDCLFIGGTAEFKLSDEARRAISDAKARGKWAHMGRVNSLRRLRLAAAWGCDSADGTHTRYAPERRGAQIVRWVRMVNSQSALAV